VLTVVVQVGMGEEGGYNEGSIIQCEGVRRR